MLDVKMFELEKTYPQYQPSKDEQVRTNYVKTRIAAMQAARTVVDKDWDIYQTMIDAIWAPYPDERSSSTVPLASSIIELFVAEATKIKTEFNFKAETSKYGANAKAFEYSWKYLWRKNNWNKPLEEAEYITGGFGNCVLYTGYESYSKIQSDPIVDENTGEITWKEKEIIKDNIIIDMCDIRQFYMDNQAIKGIEDASDCAYRQRISYDKFLNFENNPLYKNIDKVAPKGYSNEWKTFITKEEAIKAGDYVEIRHYWNVEKDAYIELANGIEIREHPMVSTIDGEKALPFVWRGLGKKNYQIYSRGFCEALLMFNSEINNLREMLMDGIRRSNSQVLAIGNGLKFNGRGFSYDNQILTFDGKLGNDNFQQISGQAPNQAIFSYIEQLYRDISVYIGIDIQNVMGEPDLTAYQTEVKRESSQKRMNVWLSNRDHAYERLANLLKDLIQTYFPKKDAEGLYPIIEVEDEELQPATAEKPAKFKKKRGNSIFEVTPEILRGDIYIDVYTNVSAPTIGAVDREQKKALLAELGTIGQGLMLAKQSGLDVESIIPTKSILRDLAADYGLEVVEGNAQQEDVEAGKKELMQQLMNMQQSANGLNEQAPEELGQPSQATSEPVQPQLAPNPMQGGGFQ